jgi:hypothetical protein
MLLVTDRGTGRQNEFWCVHESRRRLSIALDLHDCGRDALDGIGEVIRKLRQHTPIVAAKRPPRITRMGGHGFAAAIARAERPPPFAERVLSNLFFLPTTRAGARWTIVQTASTTAVRQEVTFGRTSSNLSTDESIGFRSVDAFYRRSSLRFGRNVPGDALLFRLFPVPDAETLSVHLEQCFITAELAFHVVYHLSLHTRRCRKMSASPPSMFLTKPGPGPLLRVNTRPDSTKPSGFDRHRDKVHNL